MDVPGKRNDEENAKEKLYTYASHVTVISFKAGLFSPYHVICFVDLRPSGSPNNRRRHRVKEAPVEKFLCTHVLSFIMIFSCIAPVYGICRGNQINFISHLSCIALLTFTQADRPFKIIIIRVDEST